MEDTPVDMIPDRPWQGPFPTWEAAVDACPPHASPWASATWLRRQEQLTAQTRETILAPPRPTTLPVLAAVTRARSILDFGGGSGWILPLLDRTCPEHCVARYVVAEVAEACEYFAELENSDNRLKFIPISRCQDMGNFDIVYSNSTLQYGASPEHLLAACTAAGPSPLIIFDGLLASPDRDFFLIQYVYGAWVPVHIYSLTDLRIQLHGLGYEIRVMTKMLGPFREGYSYDLPLEHLNSPAMNASRYCLVAEYG